MTKSSKIYEFGLWIIIALSIGLTIYSTWCGLARTYDSFDYLAAATSFREGEILTNQNGSPYNFHAPLFPVLLSLLGENPTKSLVLLNTVICIFTLLLIFIITRKFFSNYFLYLLGYVSICVNTGFQMIHHFLWTEPIFLLLFVIHNYLLLRFFKKERKADFWFLVSIAFFMGITKNAGFFIILITSGIILYFSKRAAFNKSAIYIFFGSFGFIVWNIYVFVFRNGEQMFRNNEFLKSIDLNFFNYVNVISQWFLPGIIPVWFRLIFLAFTLIIFFKIYQKDTPVIQVKIFSIQFLAYLIIMIVAIKVDKDEIERLLAIVLPWLILAIFMTIDINWKNISTTFKRLIMALLILWVSYTGFRGVYNSINWHKKNCSTEKLSNIKK